MNHSGGGCAQRVHGGHCRDEGTRGQRPEPNTTNHSDVACIAENLQLNITQQYSLLVPIYMSHTHTHTRTHTHTHTHTPFGWFPGPHRPHDTGTVYFKQPSDGRERAALHTVDKRGSDAKLGFLGPPGFHSHARTTKGSAPSSYGIWWVVKKAAWTRQWHSNDCPGTSPRWQRWRLGTPYGERDKFHAAPPIHHIHRLMPQSTPWVAYAHFIRH